MYKCSFCGKSSKPGELRETIIKRHWVKEKINGKVEPDAKIVSQIKSEKPICRACAAKKRNKPRKEEE